MSSNSKERRKKARAIIDRELERCRHLTDTWHATARRQIEEVSSVASDLLSDNPPKAADAAADLFSLWIGFQADACDLLHESYTHCLADDKPGKSDVPGQASGGTSVSVSTLADIEFEIEAVAEAADPQLVDVAYADRAALATSSLTLVAGSGPASAPARIPAAHVRVSTYGEEVFVSLVHLLPLKLVAGTYQGSLLLNGQQIAVIRVTIT